MDNQSTETKAQLVDRIEKIAARGVTTLTDWERSFLGSLRDSAKKWGRLTAKQHDVFQRIERKSNPEHIAARKKWNESFTPAMRENLKFAAEYYKANPPYFSDAADRILSNDEYMPSEKLYRKMVENKYVQRALNNTNETAKFPPGTMAMVRDSAQVQGRICAHRGQLVMVVECADKVRSATKGSRRLTVLPVGGMETIKTEERFLKNAKV
tara:strand:- start:236 stop:868 length:633 start_codon:yes stop_codon:yes gene_type:complete